MGQARAFGIKRYLIDVALEDGKSYTLDKAKELIEKVAKAKP